ncbi:MAG: glycosyltransferase family 2 protein [Candidatus Woesearchaeota archaeon]
MVKRLIAMPAYNEGKVIARVIRSIKLEGFKDILVVDDCSQDNTSSEAKKSGAIVLRHLINRGAGAATMTAISYAKEQGFDELVLIDSDGQHLPKDIHKLVRAKGDVVLGYRNFKSKKIPLSRRFFNIVGNLITWIFFGLYVKDSQSGFKVLRKRALQKIVLTYDRFEFCSELIGEIKKKNLKYSQVPINVIYNDYSRSKGQSFFNGIKMVLRLIFR